MKGKTDMQNVSLTITVPRDRAMRVLQMLRETATLDELDGEGVGAAIRNVETPAPTPAPRRGRPPKAAAAPVAEEETTEDDSLFAETSSDDAPEAEEEEEQTMTLEELQAGLRKIGNPKAIVAMMEKKFKVRSIAKLDPSQYEACLKAAKALK